LEDVLKKMEVDTSAYKFCSL